MKKLSEPEREKYLNRRRRIRFHMKKKTQKFNHNRRKTAKSLNISERTLYRKIQEYGIIKKKNIDKN